jgi:short-subunit dehydrogenase
MGKAMAELLTAKGYDVVVVARREERLKALQVALEHRWAVRVVPLAPSFAHDGRSVLGALS